MEESSKKKSRKAKLIPRNFEVLEEAGQCSYDESSRAAEFLQNQPTTSLNKIKDKINNEVFYKTGLERSPRFSIEIEVEKPDEIIETGRYVFDEEPQAEMTTDEIERLLSPFKPYRPVIFDPSLFACEVSKALARPSNIVDQKIEVEIRNLWVKHLNVPKLSTHETALQKVLFEWRNWACQSKFIRTTVLAYKCLVCSIGWWHLDPFREHIKCHDNVKLSIDPEYHECSIVASCGEWFENMCKVKIDEKCYRCQRSFHLHTVKDRDQYSCTGCGMKVGTCSLLFKHEGQCQRYQKIAFENEILHESFYKCDICGVLCLTKSRYEDHYKYFHDVRSDMHSAVDVTLRKVCAFCYKKFWIYNTHVCSAKVGMFKCQHCFRCFQNKYMLYVHTKFTKKSVQCQFCGEHLPTQCMELEHYIQHSKKYRMMITCAYCRDYVFFFHPMGLHKHHNSEHPTRQRRRDCQMTIVPIHCLRLELPAAGLTMQDMTEPREPHDEIPVYPLGFDATFDHIRHEASENPSKRLSVQDSDGSPDLCTEKPGCSGQNQMEVDIKAEVVTEDVVLQDLIDDDNIDDDRIEEEEIEIQRFLERNIIKKEPSFPQETHDSDSDSPLIMIDDSELTKKYHKQEFTEGNLGGNINQDSKLTEVSHEEDFTETNLDRIIKQERLSIEEHSIQENLVEMQENVLKQERLSLEDEKAVRSQATESSSGKMTTMNQESEEDIKKSIKKELENEPCNQKETSNQEESTGQKESCNLIEALNQIEPSQLTMQNVTIKEEIINYEDNLINYCEDDVEMINESDVPITIEEVKIKKEPISDDLSTVFENSKDFETVLNKSDKLLLDSDGIKDELIIKDEPLEVISGSDSDCDIVMPREYFKSKKKSGKPLTILKGATRACKLLKDKNVKNVKYYPCRHCLFVGIHHEYKKHKLVCPNSDNDGKKESAKKLTDLRKEEAARARSLLEDMNVQNIKYYPCKHCEFIGLHYEYKQHKLVCPNKQTDTTTASRQTHRTFKCCPCSKCGRKFYDVRKYLLHLPVHGLDMNKCPVCFINVRPLASHVTGHIKHSFLKLQILDESAKMCTSRMNGLYQCKTCPRKVTYEDFFTHWESHFELKSHPDEPEYEGKMEIVEENAFTLKSEEIKALIEQVSSPTDFIGKSCIQCGREFARRSDVKRHAIEHLLQSAIALSPSRGLQCQHCPLAFEKSEQYKEHLRIVAALPVFKCQICDKTFSDSSNFAKHKKVHNLKILICDICRKKFTSKVQLEKHIKMHAMTDPISCSQCDATLYSESAYRRHVRARHSRGQQRFRCKICRIPFKTLKETWDHLWEAHKERKFNADCPICKESFRKYQDVKNHVKQVHGRDRMGKLLPPEFVQKYRESKRRVNKPKKTDMTSIDEFLENTKVVEFDDPEQETWVVYDESP